MNRHSSKVVTPDRVAIYIRWSTEEQTNNTTQEVQREACEAFAKSRGWSVPDHLVFIDDGYSGGSMDRPGLTALREAVRQAQVDAVIIYRLDRLSRRLKDCINLVQGEWEHIAMLSTRENFDTKDPIGEMIFAQLASFAAFERNTIKERTHTGRRKRASQGKFAGGSLPHGYRYTPDEGWRIVEPEAELIRLIYGLYVDGWGVDRICRKLNREGRPTIAGGAFWREGTLRYLLQNRAYTGLYRFDGVECEDVAPPIIEQDLFNQVQSLRAMRQNQIACRPKEGVGVDRVYILSGIARCAKCGSPMIGQLHGRPTKCARDRKKFPGYRAYRCQAKKMGKCDCAIITADELERVMIKQVKAHLEPAKLEDHLLEIAARRARNIGDCERSLAEAQRQVREITAQIETLQREFFADREAMNFRTFAGLVEKLESRRVEQEQAVQEGVALLSSVRTSNDEHQIRLLKQIGSMAQIVDQLSPEQLRRLLEQVIGKLQVYRDKVDPRSPKDQRPTYIDWEPRFNFDS